GRGGVEGGQVEAVTGGGYRAAGVDLAPDEVFVILRGREGFEVAGDEGILVALDTTVTPELLAEGRARELVRKLNDLRKEAGFDLADRIRVRYAADDGWPKVIDAFRDTICAETLALDFTPGVQGSGHRWDGSVDGERIGLELIRA